jgi:hypothetical protein
LIVHHQGAADVSLGPLLDPNVRQSCLSLRKEMRDGDGCPYMITVDRSLPKHIRGIWPSRFHLPFGEAKKNRLAHRPQLASPKSSHSAILLSCRMYNPNSGPPRRSNSIPRAIEAPPSGFHLALHLQYKTFEFVGPVLVLQRQLAGQYSLR